MEYSTSEHTTVQHSTVCTVRMCGSWLAVVGKITSNRVCTERCEPITAIAIMAKLW